MNTILLLGMPGGGELFIVVLVIIMLFGSKKIPELARGLGKGMREIKNATGDIQREIREGARDLNSVKDKVDVEKQVKDLIKDHTDTSTATEAERVDADQAERSVDVKEEAAGPTPVQRRGPYASADENPSDKS